MNVLFVCSGNICRSPMAEAYLRHVVEQRQLAAVHVESAGLLGIEGEPASREAVHVLAETGVDLSRHRSRGLRREHLEKANLVLVMTAAHRREIERFFPGGAHRIELLRAFEAAPSPVDRAADLADPIGEPADVYRACFHTIRRCVDQLVEHIEGAK